MSTRWQKVVRDFWQERTRTVLVVLAIAIGISAFSTVLSSYAILTRELDQGYLATNPASFTLVMDKADDVLMASIAANPGVGAAEARRTVSGRIKAGPVEWRNLVLFVVKDYGDIRVSRLVPEQGAWPPAKGEILIERDALQVAKARIGDSVTVKTAQSQEQVLRVSGTAHDVGQAQARMENIVYGYVTLDTLAQLGEEPYLDRVNIVVAQNQFDEPHIRNVADEVKTLVEAQGHTVRRVDVPKPGKHPHTDIMGLLLMAMAGFGLFALILSGVLVVNLLTALMAAQVRQIGVMKAVGGTRWQIARIYFAQALLLGAAAIVIALPVGMLGSRILCRYMAVFLNFDITSFGVPVWVYLLVAGVGLVVPLLAAAYPVWRGSGVSVREALADYGVARNAFGTNGFDRALAGMSGIARPLLLAIRNSFRRRARLVLTLLTLAVSGLFFMSALNVRASMIYTLDRLFDTKQFDLTVVFGAMVPFEKIEHAIGKTPGIARAEGWIFTQASIAESSSASTANGGGMHGGAGGGLHGGGAPAADSFSVIGLPDNTTMLKPDIVEGRNLLPGETDTIVVNSVLASRSARLKVGDSVNLRMGPAEKVWRIVGIAQEPFSPSVAYVPRQYFEEAGGHVGMTNSLRLVLEKTDRDSMNAVKATLDQTLDQEGIRALGSTSKGEGRFGFDQHMVMIYVFLIVMSCILAGVGGLGLMTTMSLNVLERRREMGVLRAIGATPRTVWLIVVAEGGVIGVLSWALAGLAAWPVSKALGDLILTLMFKTRLSFLFELRGLLIWLIVSLCLCVVASFWPAWRASRQSVREAIGYE
ncbi:MAG TPA: FtsX-like permease family protein [Blastocatellia bacterium]|nr:FtsX-like permease family protein [Blastocatellia bacterium]